jgi:glycosyltransferase involved in cell wall biosynthesis
MTRTRVLKIVPTLLCGGTETQFMALSGALDPQRFQVDLACLRHRGPFATEAGAQGATIREYPIGPFRSARTLALQTRLARDLVRDRVQIVHAYNFYGNVFAIPPARLAGTPVILASIRDRGLYQSPTQLRVQRALCRAATRVVVNAAAVRDWLVDDGYDPARIVVIPNGVDLARFEAAVDRTALRQELGLAPETRLVTVVSRLNRLKGIEHFLEAAAVVATVRPDVHFLVVGEPGLGHERYLQVLARLTQLLRLDARVHFAGLRRDVPALLASSDVSVMPSLNEALPNVLLESMAAGAATVASRVGGVSEAATDGVDGLLVPPGDIAALAVAIGRLLDDRALAGRLGRTARETVASRFSLRRMAQATEALYRELLAERGVRERAA